MSQNTDLYRAMIESSSNNQEATSRPPDGPEGDQEPTAHAPDRPPDEFIIAQQNDIRAESSAVPYVGDLVPLLDLKAGVHRGGEEGFALTFRTFERSVSNMSLCTEYASGNPVFLGKIERLSLSFGSMRRTRGDGNCFYRAFAYAYLEGLLLDFDLQECKRSVILLFKSHSNLDAPLIFLCSVLLLIFSQVHRMH